MLLLKWSLVALLAGHAADSASSWQRPEQNPLLGQRFNASSVGIKFGVIGAVAVAEIELTRRHAGLAKPFAGTNYAAAGLVTGVAIRNWRTKP